MVAIYERFAESLYLMECKTGFSTLGHRHRRVAVPHPNAGKPGHPDATTSGRMTAEDLDKFERWRSLMRKDPEVLAILQREMVVYNAALAIFEAQLDECGIVRNGSKVKTLCDCSSDVCVLLTNICGGNGYTPVIIQVYIHCDILPMFPQWYALR